MRQVDGMKDVCLTLGGPQEALETEQLLMQEESLANVGVSRSHSRCASALKG